MDLGTAGTSEFREISMEETLRKLATSEHGLAEGEAAKRIEKLGYNEIAAAKRNLLLEFLRRYWGPMPWLLETAMGLSFILRHYPEGIIIFVLLTMNAIIGHLHSQGSQRTVELLRKKLALKAKVLREGEWAIKEAREIVPGDIISVRLGDIVPADSKAANGEVSVDQSSLTGESLPVDVSAMGILYSGSVVKRGEAICVVVNTGENTYFGKTAGLVRIAKPKSHQQEVMMAIVKYMMYLGITASALVSAAALTMHSSWIMIFTFVLIFLMGAVPVALPAVLTIVQAVGAMELAQKGALVTRLDSIEDAASIDVLCLDKTGTITENKLSVSEVVSFPGFTEQDVITVAGLASRKEGMDAIDLAVLDHAGTIGIDFPRYTYVSYTPFNPSIRRSEAVVEAGGEQFKAVKGAVQVVLSLCRNTSKADMDKATKITGEFSVKGYRAIAVARGGIGEGDTMTLVGLLSLSDPPRADAGEMIRQAKMLGIKPIMLTGDNMAIAKEIAGRVGIGRRIIRLADIDGLQEAEQVEIVAGSDGLAEIYPEHKYKIVKLLQSRGHVVGMTGDGVNDAPALKQAEMGIAVSNSTDVAKSSASVVLTEPGISVIIDAVKISRQTYQRMLSWVINKVTKVIEFVGLLTAGFLWLHQLVLSLLGMALLVFANDFVTMSLATDNVTYTPDPNKWHVKNIILASLVPGMLLVIGDTVVILAGMHYFHLPWEHLRSLVMLNLIFNSQFRVLIMRERRHFWSSMPGGKLLILNAATIIAFGLMTVYGILVPALTWYQVSVLLGFSALFTFCIDFPKYYLFGKFGLRLESEKGY
jgi:H+-transporting ATPase